MDDVDITRLLATRPARAPEFEAEAAALRELAAQLSSDPEGLLQRVVDTVMVLCRADSAGVTILEGEGEDRVFRWQATAGAYAGHRLGTMPREASPCSSVIDENRVLLVDRPQRLCPALGGVEPPIFESLLAPCSSGREPVGTLWAIAHTEDRRFDAEDARLLHGLAGFAAAAWRLAKRTSVADTEWSAVRAALESSESRLRLIVDSVSEYAIFTFDPDGIITAWNSGAERMFGLPAAEAIGQPAIILFTPEDRAARVPQLELTQAVRAGHAKDERWHVRADGRRFFADGILFPLHVDGRLAGFVKVARDVTERKRHEDALEERVRERTADLRRAVDALQSEVRDRSAAEEQIKNLFRQLVTAQQEERKRIARDIHDQAGQQLTALRITLTSLALLVNGAETSAGTHVEKAQRLAEELDTTIDALTWQLRPPVLDHLGLAPALAHLLRVMSERSGIQADFDATSFSQVRLAPAVETHLYHVTQEALHNLVKHAGARHVTVFLGRRDQDAVLIIEDDGRGFDPADSSGELTGPRGLGITSMRERAALIGGEIEIESSPGSGTTVFVRVPLDAEPGV